MAPVEQYGPDGIGPEQIKRAMRTSWHRSPDRCAPLGPGMHSFTWRVQVGHQQFAARLMPASRRGQLEAALAVGDRLERGGIAAGRPVRAVDGSLTVPIDGAVLAVLTWVPGRALDGGDGLDQQWWGDGLGAVHRQLRGFTHPGLRRFPWVRADAAHLDVEPWVRPAVAGALAVVQKLSVTDQLTYGVLHGDPGPHAIRLDPETGRIGLVDWGVAGTGPLTYDIASAVRYAGGAHQATDLIEAYLAAAPVVREELDAALPAMLRLRWAVEADDAAHRLAVRGRHGGGQAGADRSGHGGGLGGAGGGSETQAALACLHRAGSALAGSPERGPAPDPERGPAPGT